VSGADRAGGPARVGPGWTSNPAPSRRGARPPSQRTGPHPMGWGLIVFPTTERFISPHADVAADERSAASRPADGVSPRALAPGPPPWATVNHPMDRHPINLSVSETFKGGDLLVCSWPEHRTTPRPSPIGRRSSRPEAERRPRRSRRRRWTRELRSLRIPHPREPQRPRRGRLHLRRLDALGVERVSGLDVHVVAQNDGRLRIVVGGRVVWRGWPGEAARLAQMLDDAADDVMHAHKEASA